MNEKILKAYASAPKTWIWKMLAAFGIACLLAWSGSAVRVSNPTGNGLEVAGNILSGIFHPSAKLLFTLGTDGVPYLLLETFCIAFLGTIVGAVISLPLSFLSASNLVPKGVAFIGRVLIAAIRTIPAFVYGLMFIRVTGPGPFAGLLTMSLCSIGMVSKMFIESIEDLDKRILESLDAAGCTTFQKIRYGILPQLTADFTSTIIYRFDMNLRDATVLGLVGAGGIGAPLIFAMSAYRWNEVGAILLGLIVLVFQAVLLAHGGDASHLPLDKGNLAHTGFSYAALGHIHKPQILIRDQAAFSGALEPIDRNDTGEHGYMEGRVVNGRIRTEFVPFACRSYQQLVMPLLEETTQISLEEAVKSQIFRRGGRNIYRIIRQGMRSPDLLLIPEKLKSLGNITDVVDESWPAYDLEELYKRYSGTLIGDYIGYFLAKGRMDTVEKKALYYGLQALLETGSRR